MSARGLQCAGCLLALYAASATSADWVWVDTPDMHQHYYDRSKVFADGDQVTYWRRVVFRSPQPAKAGTARSAMYRERIDCKAHTHKTLGYLLYGADAVVIENTYTPEATAEPVIPETIGDHYEKLMCGLAAANRSAPAAAAPEPTSGAPRAEPSLTSQEAVRGEIERLETRLRELKAQLPSPEGASALSGPAPRPANP